MFILDQSPGRIATIDGKEHLFFSGYAYLGMSHVPEFIALVNEGIQKYGLMHPSSRVSNTQLNVFAEMENMLSSLTSQQETVTYSSGFLAGRAVIDWMSAQTCKSFIAPQTHPALQSSQAILLHGDWQQDLLTTLQSNVVEEIVLLVDSVNPLTACVTDFSFLKNIALHVRVTCIIDDSHGIGLLGEKGEGISALLPKHPNITYIITYSLSKAFHINGGAISCDKETAASLRQSPFYTASTAIAPAHCYAFINGQKLYNNQRALLLKNIAHLNDATINIDSIHTHPQLPIAVLPLNLEQDYFTPHNIIISSFAYPNPSGNKINRLVLSALHTQDDIAKVSTLIKKG